MDRNSTPGKNHPSYKTQFNSIQDIQQRLDFYINLDQPIVPPSGIFNILFIRFFLDFIFILYFSIFLISLLRTQGGTRNQNKTIT